MRGWRIKVVFLLIVYFSGFATAIYYLAPAPENRSVRLFENTSAFSALKSDDFAQSFNAGLHKCVDFGKDAAWRTANFIREKIEEQRLGREG